MNELPLPLELESITEKIIGYSFKVSNTLGIGYLEKVYENALLHELRKSGLNAVQQFPIKVHYDGVVMGDFVADLLVEKAVLVELKVVNMLAQVHEAQALNYLRATGLPVCLLINFGRSRIEVRRLVPSPKWGRKS